MGKTVFTLKRSLGRLDANPLTDKAQLSRVPFLWVQGRIQDLKLGVAQMDWYILKTGGGGGGGGGGVIVLYRN